MRITFSGDILCYQSQDRLCLKKDGTRDYKPIFEQVKPIFDKSDYVVGSLETTFAGKKEKYTHEDISFNSPDELLDALKWVGFDMLTTATNHCFDRGFVGHKRTIELLKSKGIDFTGTRLSEKEKPYLVKQFGDTRIAFISYTYGTNSDYNGFFIPRGGECLVNLTRPQDPAIQRPLWKKTAKFVLRPILKRFETNKPVEDCVNDLEVNDIRNKDYEGKMLNVIADAKKNADIVIMCLHSGGQFNEKVGAYTNHLFELIAETGADAIICNHAHTILPIYKKGNCLIASALGNFSFSPGEGYWVDGANAEYSVLLNLEIYDKHIADFSIDVCNCIKDDNGLSITSLCEDDYMISTIKANLLNNKL